MQPTDIYTLCKKNFALKIKIVKHNGVSKKYRGIKPKPFTRHYSAANFLDRVQGDENFYQKNPN